MLEPISRGVLDHPLSRVMTVEDVARMPQNTRWRKEEAYGGWRCRGSQESDRLRVAPEFLFFWGHTAKDQKIGKNVLSQWWPATFSAVRGVGGK